MEFPSPTPRRVSRPRWLDLRLVLGIVLVLAAVLIGAKVVANARHTEKELAVTHDLSAGTTVRAGDLASVNAQLPNGTTGTHVYLTDKKQAVGKVLSQPLRKGELLPASALATAPGRTTVSVPFATDAAPKLGRGQRIEIWLTTKACPSVVLLDDVTIQDVHAADASNFASGGAGQDVVLSVAPDLAQRVVGALAIQDASIRAGVLTGTPAADPAALPSLDTCGASSSP